MNVIGKMSSRFCSTPHREEKWHYEIVYFSRKEQIDGKDIHWASKSLWKEADILKSSMKCDEEKEDEDRWICREVLNASKSCQRHEGEHMTLCNHNFPNTVTPRKDMSTSHPDLEWRAQDRKERTCHDRCRFSARQHVCVAFCFREKRTGECNGEKRRRTQNRAVYISLKRPAGQETMRYD
jgi:hypothetical protein